jgi:pimeloyl-ACP methyl ester carboxylesterase
MLGLEGPGLAIERDLVLFDARAAGRSTPDVCDRAGNADLRVAVADLDREQGIVAYRREVAACAAELERLGIDPGDYDVDAQVDDVEALRVALGYERWHVLGRSFGGLLALRLLQQHPSSVSSAVLVNPLSPDWYGFEHATPLADSAITHIYDICLGVAACRRAFPDGRSEVEAVHSSLLREPWRIAVDSSIVGAPHFTVNASDFMMVVGQLLYADFGMRQLPAVVHAFATRDSLAVGAAIERLAGTLGDQVMITQFSVWCRDAVTTDSRTAWERASEDYSAAMRDIWYIWLEVCEEWPVAPEASPDRRVPVVEVPVLIVSGALDPIVGLAPAERIARTLPNGRHIVFPATSHVLPASAPMAECAFRLMREFFRQPSIPLDAACADSIPPLRIMTGLSDLSATAR